MEHINEYIKLFKDNGIFIKTEADENTEIKFISYDSNRVESGTLFLCKGAHFKEEYLKSAAEKGAVAYVSEKDYNIGIPCILVSDVRKAMCLMAVFYYKKCYEKFTLIGITGTKGKSTTTYFLKYILDLYLESQKEKLCGVISSIDTFDGIESFESHLTTPEPFDLHRHFDNAAKTGLKYMVMEVSSQALKYGRVYGVNFDVGCYLNIGIDHISDVEHPTFEDYFESKMKIFSQCKTGVVNLDSDKADEVMKYAKNAPKIITFSTKNKNADVYGYNIHKSGSDTIFTVRTKDFEREITLTIPGLFNVENALCAIAVCVSLNIPEEFIVKGLYIAKSSGRMEIYENYDKSITAIVDYAHNRLSFETLFKSVEKEYPGRKVVIVYGCPGKKAFIRRKDLGEISGKYAYMSYLTEEDAGEEPIHQISEEIATHIESVGGRYKIIDDRGEAIRTAIFDCGQNSVILITGKGNETRQKRGTQYIDCPTDVEYAVSALKEFDEINGITGEQNEKR